MYLPKSKYRIIAAKSGEFRDSSGQEYIGLVVETFTGACYPGTDPRTMGPKLTKTEDKPAQSLGFYNIKRIPTEAEYKTGYITRYFVQEIKTQKIIEIAPEAYQNADQSSILYTFQVVDWILTGNRTKVQESNLVTIQRLEQLMPGIVSSRVLWDPLQFYRKI